MKLSIIKITYVSILLSVTLLNCHSHDHPHDEPSAHDHSHQAEDSHSHDEEDAQMHNEEEDGEEIGLTEEQIEKINLQLSTFEQKNLKSTLKVNGKLELPPQNKADVSALIPGKITRIWVRPGQYVKRGATLATLYNLDLIDWQQEYMEVQSELQFLEKEYERQQDLVSKEIAPQKQLDKINSERNIAKAKLAGLGSRMKNLGIPIPEGATTEMKTHFAITSPISGFVRAININTGTFAEQQKSLFEIVDNHHLHIDFMVFEKDLPKIKINQVINFNLQSQPKNVMQAKIFSIGKALNESDRTLSVHAEIIDEKIELVTGMYVEGRIVLADETIAALPEESITVDKGLHYIFVKEDEHDGETHFKKIPVLKGVTDQGYVEITPMEDLADNAQIVTEGAYFLMAQSKKGEEGGGHHH